MILEWSEIDTVFLDMDGTLLDLHFDNFFWLSHLPDHYATQFPENEDQARRKLHQQIMSRRGTLPWYCTDFWSEHLGLDIIALKRQISHLIKQRPYSIDFLRALANEGKARVLLTNAHRDGIDLKFSVTGIDAHLDNVISSHDFDHPKESQLFWQGLQSSMPFDNNRVLFVDDSESVLSAARDYGIKHLLRIAKPDSQKPAVLESSFPSIVDFDQLLSDAGNLLCDG